ncbi:hypothetical protein AWZ03_004698 [Drosophila navojoa]|uniref:Uncharacterized protein n=1 Tax=Drosophila navojoa TaxID=7232 RepID=A0A484BLS8_DRONA|nr:hypothetical protein AWZ03_004698 [Drosophila navojoa]
MSTKRSKSKVKLPVNTNQFTFMRQIDNSQQERSATREERERVANNFRRLGNFAYRKGQFNNAIDLYNHGLEYITDTPVLYLNRACCYIRLRSFQRAIMDCDYILNKLNPKHVRAWLYRALAFKRLHEENKFNDCIRQLQSICSQQQEQEQEQEQQE